MFTNQSLLFCSLCYLSDLSLKRIQEDDKMSDFSSASSSGEVESNGMEEPPHGKLHEIWLSILQLSPFKIQLNRNFVQLIEI